MLNKVKNYIRDNELINEKDKILVALSGGPDSICLLHVLYSLKDEYNLTIGTAHVNHLLRGDDSTGDEEYVKKICEKLSIECYIARIDINEVAKKRGISHEMAGRDERYKFFEAIKNKNDYDKVAVAHNANDQVETVIMRMMRGTGLDGLCGIRAKRQGDIIRPILCLERSEIEEYCNINSLSPRIDKSNMEKVYSRNKIRLDIIPYMKENFNQDIIESVNRMVSILQKDNDFIQKEVDVKFKEYCSMNKDQMIISNKLFSLEEALVTRCIRKAFIEYSQKYTNFDMKHIYDLIELAKLGTNKRMDLPNKIVAENIYGDIYLKKRFANIENLNKELLLNKEGIDGFNTCFGEYLVSFEIMDNKNNMKISNNDLIKYFDYDNIKEELCIRTRRDGDRIRPFGMKGNKKIKDILMDMKVPVDKRGEIPIVCFDEKISWIVGYKVSDEYKITKQTKKIIKITFLGKE